MAQRLLADARAWPALINRTDPASAVIKGGVRKFRPAPRAAFPAMALLSDPTLDVGAISKSWSRSPSTRRSGSRMFRCKPARPAGRRGAACRCRMPRCTRSHRGRRWVRCQPGRQCQAVGGSQGTRRASEMQRQAQYQLASIVLRQSDQQTDMKSVDLLSVTPQTAARLRAPVLAPPAFSHLSRIKPWPDSRKPVTSRSGAKPACGGSAVFLRHPAQPRTFSVKQHPRPDAALGQDCNYRIDERLA